MCQQWTLTRDVGALLAGLLAQVLDAIVLTGDFADEERPRWLASSGGCVRVRRLAGHCASQYQRLFSYCASKAQRGITLKALEPGAQLKAESWIPSALLSSP